MVTFIIRYLVFETVKAIETDLDGFGKSYYDDFNEDNLERDESVAISSSDGSNSFKGSLINQND